MFETPTFYVIKIVISLKSIPLNTCWNVVMLMKGFLTGLQGYVLQKRLGNDLGNQ